MTRARLVLATATLGVFAAAAACTELREADEIGPGGTLDAGPTTEDGDAPTRDPGASKDAEGPEETPPLDTACTEAWTVTAKKDAACAKRVSTAIPGFETFLARRVSIARTSKGRIGIATNNVYDVEGTEMLLAHFVAPAPGFTASVLRRTPSSSFTQWGHATKVVASGPDTLGVLSHDVDSDSGPIVFVEHVGGTQGFAAPLVVATTVSINTELDGVSDGAGTVHAAFMTRTAPDSGRLDAARRAPGGTFAATGPIDASLLVDPFVVGGSGQVSLAMSNGNLEALYHQTKSSLFSQPVFTAYTGVAWSGRVIVDNMTTDGYYGFSPRLATHGTRKFATYFARRSQQQTGKEVADLKLATWDATTAPTYETIAAGLPAADKAFPSYRAAMTVDRFGLVHVLWSEPGSEAAPGALRYKRQTRDANRVVSWVTDVIDPAVMTSNEPPMLDLIVDAGLRPHIAYIPADGKVRYATRYDR